MGLILSRIPPPTPVLYSALTNLHKTLAPTLNPTPKHPLSWPSGLNLKVGKMNYTVTTVWAKWTPTGQNVLKSGQNLSRSGQKKYSCGALRCLRRNSGKMNNRLLLPGKCAWSAKSALSVSLLCRLHLPSARFLFPHSLHNWGRQAETALSVG